MRANGILGPECNKEGGVRDDTQGLANSVEGSTIQTERGWRWKREDMFTS